MVTLNPIDLDVAKRMSGDAEFAREWVEMTEARIAELEAALRPLAAMVDRPWHGCATAWQSVNRDNAEAAANLLAR